MRKLTVLVLALAACLPSQSSNSTIVLREFEVDAPQRLESGPVELEVTNEGEFGHTLLVSTVDGTVLSSTGVLAPGETRSLHFDLEPGQYQFSCRIVVQTPNGSIVDHYAEGMAASVTVTAP